MITKYYQAISNGAEFQVISNLCIGYIVSGTKYIHRDDKRYQFNKGEVYYINAGRYYMENIPEEKSKFEEIIVVYSPTQLSSILSCLSRVFQFTVENTHSCDCCHLRSTICKSSINLSNFFNSLNQYIKDNTFKTKTVVETLKKTELIYLALASENCCIKSKILNYNTLNCQFEQVVHDSIFKNVALGQLAKECGLSLTAFKNKFKQHFAVSPRKWMTEQRLRHSKFLLISTNKPVMTVGRECLFVNASHFIKLFKAQYGCTPAFYRSECITVDVF